MATSAQRKAGAAAALVLAALLLVGFAYSGGDEPGEGGKDPDVPPPDCGPGKTPKWVRSHETGKREWQCVDKEEPGGGVITGEVKDVPGEPDKPTPTGELIICAPGSHLDPSTGTCVSDEPVEPPPEEPEDVNDIIKDFPEGGNFYQVKLGDMAYGTDIERSIAYRYLRREAFLAARDLGGQTDSDAMIFAGKVANNNARRIMAWEIIQCSGANDAVYETWGYDPEKDPDPGPHGRTIRLVAQHADNLGRLKNGQSLLRCIKFGSSSKPGNGSGVRADDSCHSFELLWLPQLDRQKLWDSGGTTVTADGVKWPDGESKGLPPTFIMDRGLDFLDGALPEPFLKVWGCFDLKLVLE